MTNSTLTCRNEQRHKLLRTQGRSNGLDYLEVSDDQLTLLVYFLGAVPTNLTKNNLRIDGGQRIRNIRITNVQVEQSEDPALDGYLRVSVDQYGDFSTYILSLVESSRQGTIDERGELVPPRPLAGFDRRYAQLSFNFKVACPSNLDCKTESVCPPAEQIEPEINYLAKDYASFRQLILDRLALTMPTWQERHVPDLGITLVELLAYVGDYLSYYQDAVATEAYLDTARQRISVRRHSRLVDYHMHEGCNARTWLWLELKGMAQKSIDLRDVYWITSYQNAPIDRRILTPTDLLDIPAQQYEVFEPIFPIGHSQIQLYEAHNQISFHTWGDRQCCLPKGSTTATLQDHWQIPQKAASLQQNSDAGEPPNLAAPMQLERQLNLKPGDILIFAEVKGAKTGAKADADPSHCHAVRLIKVQLVEDELLPYSSADENLRNLPTPIVEIEWAIEDALPFPLCISAIGAAPACCLIENISVARGNIILVDHGKTEVPQNLGVVKEAEPIALCAAEGQPSNVSIFPIPFRPQLDRNPLTFRQPLSAQNKALIPASKLLDQDPRQALPQITTLVGVPAEYPLTDHQEIPGDDEWKWVPQSDLLNSYSQDRHFVVEMDNEGFAHLRFGDGELGKQPAVGTRFFATYRIGNGLVGNIGANTINHTVFLQPLSGITLTPHNPFPAKGGTPPEPLSDVKLFAPTAFHKKLQRAITAQDYADIVMRDFPNQVQRAAAILRWTGSWPEVLVAIDPRNTEVASQQLLQEIYEHLHLYRRMGHDLVVKSTVYVSLAIAMRICVLPDYLRGHVEAALMEIFSNRRLANGQLGFFHPDNLTFGTGIYLSKLVAAAQAVPGVMSIQVTRLKRLVDVANPSQVPTVAESNSPEILNGVLPLSPWEIARLDSDPSFPENGVLKLEIGGGR
jgi:hypothetical protein